MSNKLARDLERYADLVEDCALISPEEMNCASVMRLSAEALLSKTVEHWSDCAVHSEPAYPKGECDCGGYKPEQQPYGYLKLNTGKFVNEVGGLNPMTDKRYLPLYTTPPQRTWVGLTDEEAHELWESTDSGDDWELMKRTEAKLKEKNT